MMMNAEADFAFGALFAKRAAEAGVLYSSADGDQYGVLKRLADEVAGWGFDLVMFGNIKGYLDRRANPVSIIPEADSRNLSYTMSAAYTDGTKLNIEMALIANVYGGRPIKLGMLGPRAERVAQVPDLFDLAELWDGGLPLVDYLIGAEPGGGVFIIGHSNDPYRRDMMRYYKLGNGPFYLFYRPYHLCHVEAVSTALQMLQSRWPLMQAVKAHTEVIAYAKVPLEADRTLDGIGGFACYGLIKPQPVHDGLPICLAVGARLNRAIGQDQRIALSDVHFSDTSELDLYARAQAIARAAE